MFKVIYEGDLRCECYHLQSGTTIETDAPTDNKGKGERFSPTDLLCISLATCMVTTMAIKIGEKGNYLKQTEVNIKKFMHHSPRSIAGIEIVLNLPAAHFDAQERLNLEDIANNCPVKLSIHQNIKLDLTYNWV